MYITNISKKLIKILNDISILHYHINQTKNTINVIFESNK